MDRPGGYPHRPPQPSSVPFCPPIEVMIQPLLLAALAISGTSSPDPSEASDWLTLDRELMSLTAALDHHEGGPQLSGFFRSGWMRSNDASFADPTGTTGATSLEGMVLRQVRVNLKGQSGDYAYKLSMEGANGTFTLRDAYVKTALAETIDMTWGRFKEPFLYSAMVGDPYNMFMDRTLNGSQGSERMEGIMIAARLENIKMMGAVQSGISSLSDDYLVTARLEYDMVGNAFRKVQGAIGSEGTNLGLAFSLQDDYGLEDGERVGVEVEVTTGSFYMGLDSVTYSDDYDDSGDPGIFFTGLYGTEQAGSTPISVTAAYLFGVGDNPCEVAIRVENPNNGLSTRRLSYGVNVYDDILGQDGKWTFNFVELDDASGYRGHRLELALNLTY